METVDGTNITDEQIRKALRETKGRGALATEIRETCRTALRTDGEHEAAVSLRRRARFYVAGVINARARAAWNARQGKEGR